MADITVTAAQVEPIYPEECDIKPYRAAEAITKGQPVYIVDATGYVGIADANAAGKQQFRGIALETVGAGQVVDVLHEGDVYGYTLSGVNADDLLYLSDTAGKLADAAGTLTVACGRVRALSDGTKILRVFVKWEADWA